MKQQFSFKKGDRVKINDGKKGYLVTTPRRNTNIASILWDDEIKIMKSNGNYSGYAMIYNIEDIVKVIKNDVDFINSLTKTYNGGYKYSE